MQFALQVMRDLTERIIAEGSEQQLIGAMIREDVRFHVAIITAAKNEIIKKQILRLHLVNRVVSSTHPVRPENSLSTIDEERKTKVRRTQVEHQEIYDAIVRGDVAAAKNAMERHIQVIIDTTLDTMMKSESGQIARELTDDELAYSS